MALHSHTHDLIPPVNRKTFTSNNTVNLSAFLSFLFWVSCNVPRHVAQGHDLALMEFYG